MHNGELAIPPRLLQSGVSCHTGPAALVTFLTARNPKCDKNRCKLNAWILQARDSLVIAAGSEPSVQHTDDHSKYFRSPLFCHPKNTNEGQAREDTKVAYEGIRIKIPKSTSPPFKENAPIWSCL